MLGIEEFFDYCMENNIVHVHSTTESGDERVTMGLIFEFDKEKNEKIVKLATSIFKKGVDYNKEKPEIEITRLTKDEYDFTADVEKECVIKVNLTRKNIAGQGIAHIIFKDKEFEYSVVKSLF